MSPPTKPLLAASLLVAFLVLLVSGCVSVRPWEDVRRQLSEERFVTLPGLDGAETQVYVERAGALRADETPVVLLHGFGGSSYAWRRLMPSLARHHRVIAPDLYGFGYTERPEELSGYTATAQSRLVVELLDALGHRSAHLVGHSYGGAIALTVAARHPERVSSLVLVDSAAPSYPRTRRHPLAALPPYAYLYVRVLGLRTGFVERVLERSYHDDSLASPEQVEAYRDRLRIEGVARAYRGLTAPQPDPGPEVELEEIEVPTLVLWGSEDPLISVETGRRATERMPRSVFRQIPGAAHAPHEERPEEVADHILGWLADGWRDMAPAEGGCSGPDGG